MLTFFSFKPRHSDKENTGKNEQRKLIASFFHANTGDSLNVKQIHCYRELFTFYSTDQRDLFNCAILQRKGW